jgi:hypothetical protein
MNDLQNVTQQIVKLHIGIENSMRRSLADAIEIGRLISQEKEKLQHGQFLPWLSTLPFTQQTANNYVRVSTYSCKLPIVCNLQEAYKLVESFEAQEKRIKEEKQRIMIRERIKTGKKPDGWDRSMDYAYDKEMREEKEYQERMEKVNKFNEREKETKQEAKQEYNGFGFDHETLIAATSKLIENEQKKADFKERIRISHEGKDDQFQDALIDYLNDLEDDNRRREACTNIIKLCKGIINDMEVKNR